MYNDLLTHLIQQHIGEDQPLPTGIDSFFAQVNTIMNACDKKIALLEEKALANENKLVTLYDELQSETRELQHAHNELSRIFTQINEGFYTKDIINNKYLHMSASCEKIYGYTAEEFYANPMLWYKVIHPADKKLVEDENDFLNKGEQILNSYHIIHKDGSTRWIELKSIPELVAGKLVKVDGVINDITGRKLMEQAISDSEVLYHSLFKNNVDGVLLGSKGGVIDAANPAACEILRCPEDLLKRFTRQDLTDFGGSGLVKLIQESELKGTSHGEFEATRRDGSKFFAEMTSTFFKDANNKERSWLIIKDITERKKAEADIALHEQQLSLIYNTVEESIFMVNIEGPDKYRYISVNESFLKTTGLDKTSVVGKYADEVLEDGNLKNGLEKLREVITRKESVSWQQEFIFPSGSKTGRVTINPVLDEQGNCVIIIGSVRDITKQLKVEQEFKASQQNFRSLVNSIDGIVWEADPKTFSFTFVSKRSVSLLGYDINAWTTEHDFWENHIHPDDRSAAVAQVKKCILLRSSEVHEYRMIAANKKTVWIQDHITVNVNENDGSCFLRGIMFDITEKKKQLQAIKKGEENYRSLVDQASDAIFIISLGGKMLDVNKSACELVGYDKTALLEMSLIDLFPPADLLHQPLGLRALLKGEATFSERNIVHYSGSVMEVDIISKMLSDGRIMAIARNISERKRSEKIIKDSEERTRLIMNSALDAIICMDKNDLITFWNPQAEKIFGWQASEALGTSLSEKIIPASFRQFHLRGLQKYLETGHGPVLNILVELTALNRAGEEFPIELTVLPIRQDGVEFFCAFIRDITQRKKSEKEILLSEARYRNLFQQNMAGIYQTTITGNFISSNQAFARMLGYDTVEDLLKINAKDLYADNSIRNTIIADLKAHKKLNNVEVTLTGKKGSLLYTLSNLTLSKNDATGEDMIEGIITDITERKIAEAQLIESENKYRLIVETSQEGIWLVDENYQTIFVNKRLCELFEYDVEEMVGRAPVSFMEVQDRPLILPAMERRRRGIKESIDLPFVTKKGKRLWVNISAAPLPAPPGKFEGALSMVTDITQRKSDEALLEQSRIALDRKNKELNRKNLELEQFAYVASHDLQEPLRTTSSFVQLLQKQYQGKLDEKADTYLRFIVNSSDRMKIFIKDLLDYSRIGSKHEIEQVDCNEVLNDVEADIYKAISDAHATINNTGLPFVPGYKTDLKQLFQNLLLNAIKFKKPGVAPEINISATEVEGFWQFAVSDNGIGIQQKHFDRIFVIFQRLHTRSEYDGSGIGLSHCKKIVELHNGKIWVESIDGEGSTFYFSIPVKPVSLD